MKFVSVIIPVLNDGDRLRRCLEKLQQQTYPRDRYEIIVIDNGSIEDIESLCHSFPNVLYAREPRAGSYTARNAGILIAKGDIFVFTDSDCLPTFDWIEQGVNSLSSSDAGIIAGHVQFVSASSKPTLIEYLDSVLHLNQAYYAQCGYSVTANLFTWAWMFDQVGLFEEAASLSDREWGMRVTKAGYSVRYSSTAYVYHPARTTLGALLRKVRLQARHKSFWNWRDIWLHLRPCGLEFWRNVRRDRNLPTIKAKLQFIGLIHYVRWVNVWEVLQVKFGGV